MGALMGNTLMKGTSAGCERGGAGLRALGLGAVVLLGLSACSGTPEVPAQTSISLGTPSTLASTTPSPSASPSATASPSDAYEPATSTSPAKNVPKPVMPALAKEKSFEGQKAFIKYWFATYNYAFDTGDASLMDQASAEDCGFCSAVSKGARQMYVTRGVWRAGGGSSPTVTSKSPTETAPGVLYSKISVQAKKAKYYGPKGSHPSYPDAQGGTVNSGFWLEYVKGSWRAVEVGD